MTFLEIVEVIIAGLGATFFMTVSEFPFWKMWGMEGVGEWQIDSVVLSRFILRKTTTIKEPDFPWQSIGVHFLDGIIASSAFYLMLPAFYFLVPDARISIIYDTIVYSFVLWIIFPILGRSTIESLGQIHISNRGLLVSLLSHMVYGIFLGLFLVLLLG